MRTIASFILLAAVALFFAGCEDEPVGTVKVEFSPATLTLNNGEISASLNPSFNVDSGYFTSVQWETTGATYLDSTVDQSLYDEPTVESVSFSPENFQDTVVTFSYQGIYTVRLTVSDNWGRQGSGTMTIFVKNGDLEPGVPASDG